MLKELVIPAVRDGGTFTSVRGFQGIPQRDIHFTATFVRSYAQEFEKLDRLRQQYLWRAWDAVRVVQSAARRRAPANAPGIHADV